MLGSKQKSTYQVRSLTLFLTEILIMTTIIGVSNIGVPIFASPIFPTRIITDDQNDGINVVYNKRDNLLQDTSSDILAVTYFSTGKTFNATYWLQGLFNEEDPKVGSKINKKSYGMFIDTDFDRNPNYRVELEKFQKFQNLNWVKGIRELQPHIVDQKSIIHRFFDIHSNYTKFHAHRERYVDLTFDLASIGYPDKYQVSFYTEQRIGCPNDPPCNNVIYDVTNWVLIPAPNILLSLSPNPLPIRPGEIQPVVVKVNSTPTSNFTLSAVNKTDVIVYLDSNRSYLPSDIPQINVKIPEKVTSGFKFTLPITANAIYSTDSLFEIKTTEDPDQPQVKNQPIENVTQKSDLIVDVLAPYGLLDNLSAFNNTVITPITGIWTFLLGVLAISVPWILRTYRQRQNR